MTVIAAQTLKRRSADVESPRDDDHIKTPKTTQDQATCPMASEVQDELVFVYDEVQLHPKSQRQLKELGILTVNDLIKRCDDFKNERILGMRKPAQQQLYYFCLWHQDFYSKNKVEVSWRDHFHYESFDAFIDQLEMPKSNDSNQAQLKALFDHAKNMLHEGSQGELSNLTVDQYERLYKYVAELVVPQLPEDLIKLCLFDVPDLIMNCARAIFNFPSQQPYPKIQMIAGMTQSGKTSVKAVVQATCDLLRCPLVIITKGVSESIDLSKKIKRMLNLDKTAFDEWYNDADRENRSTVIPDTGARINKKGIPKIAQLRGLKTHGKFAVIVDECDAMYRTDERCQQMEQAYDDFMGMMPALRIEISATPIPALLFLTDSGHQVEMLELGTSDDYAGVTDMVPLRNPKTGHNIYLSDVVKHDEGVGYKDIDKRLLTLTDGKLIFPDEDMCLGKSVECEARNFIIGRNSLEKIPYTTNSMMLLYEDALSGIGEGGAPKQGVLLLDCTASRVHAEMNVFQKAACVQNHYFQQKKKIVIVVYVGRGIYVRRPGFQCGRFVPNRITIGEVLDQLDEEFGLEMPIFVFGYSKMRRCISYRSEKRVPTHLVLYLGIGQSNESFIQALGRATFNGLETCLKKNGFKHVTVLLSYNDLQMARKYTNFVHEVSERLRGGVSLQQLLSDTKEKFKDESNFLRHTNRKTGQIKRLKDSLPGQHQFEDPTSCDERVTDEGPIIKRILRAVRDLVRDTCSDERTEELRTAEGGIAEDEDALKEINKRGFTSKEILAKYNNLYYQGDHNHTIKMASLNRKLTLLKNQAKLEKLDTGRWRAKNWKALEMDVSGAE
jgi:hypothetical protein